MRELLSQYGTLILAMIGGAVGIGLSVILFQLLQPVIHTVLEQLM